MSVNDTKAAKKEKTTRELSQQIRLSMRDKALLCVEALHNLSEYYDRTYRLTDAQDAVKALRINIQGIYDLKKQNKAKREAYAFAADIVKQAFNIA